MLPLLLGGCGSNKTSTQPIIGLITDYGTADAEVGRLKGSIFANDPEARITDISHDPQADNLLGEAFLVSEATREFPSGSILIASIGLGTSTSSTAVLLQTKANKFYLAPNNGLLTLVLQREGLDQAWELTPSDPQGSDGTTSLFGRDLLGAVAAKLALGTPPVSLGRPLSACQELDLPRPKYVGKIISGEIIHIDRQGNLITNIPLDFSDQFAEGKVYRLKIDKQIFVAPLVKSSSDLPAVGRLLMLYNGADLLEISVNQGSASRFLRINSTGPITIQP